MPRKKIIKPVKPHIRAKLIRVRGEDHWLFTVKRANPFAGQILGPYKFVGDYEPIDHSIAYRWKNRLCVVDKFYEGK